MDANKDIKPILASTHLLCIITLLVLGYVPSALACEHN